jgi:hypothetical protein
LIADGAATFARPIGKDIDHTKILSQRKEQNKNIPYAPTDRCSKHFAKSVMQQKGMPIAAIGHGFPTPRSRRIFNLAQWVEAVLNLAIICGFFI